MNQTAAHWKLETDNDAVAFLTLDKAGTSANTLSSDVLRELDAKLAELERSLPRAVVVASAKASGFVAGADIKEFTGLKTTDQAYALIRQGQQVLDRLAALRCPTVAAINGFALGGGLELALACRYRVASDSPKVSLGLPEVQLGIHPGFGGTVRAPQIAGVRAAMQMMLTGKALNGAKAAQAGLVDRIVPAAELLAQAKRHVLAAPAPRRAGFFDTLLGLVPMRTFVANGLRKQVAARARREHYPAPYAIIDLWQKYGARGPEAYEAEARSIAQLMLSATARNLVRVFLLQDRLKSLGGKSSQEFKHVHVVGAGVMGGDIAAWCVLRGMSVTLQDREEKYVKPALDRAAELFAKRLHDPKAAADARARLLMDLTGDGASRADVVIEAIFENVEAKRALYAQLEPRLKPNAILATNTSSIVLETLGERLADPGRLVGLHFFNPVAKLPLVEVIQSHLTRPEILQAGIIFTRKLDKLPLPCRSAPGFVVNRVLMPYLNEAMFLAEEGVSLALIDRAAVDFGMPMGPVELADTVGLDVCLHVGKILAEAFGRPAPTHLAKLVEAKQLGRKTGKGFYEWRDGKAVKPPASGKPPADLTDRLLLPMLNESVACLRERVVDEAALLDAGVIFGTGFAPFRGGPLAYARARGVDDVVRALKELQARHGDRFRPDEGWRQLPAE
ncbi:MAG TPA: 3-hydroxyacyl-CoA dehydrogenase NAD-binding domain-containing protein [Steroidobacteraceae bacterium]|nr:3-hydroxyacyl-CoA dehydrogenase NAD-binding domain-containing protein [Steroidobacteraceae bacterium]